MTSSMATSNRIISLCQRVNLVSIQLQNILPVMLKYSFSITMIMAMSWLTWMFSYFVSYISAALPMFLDEVLYYSWCTYFLNLPARRFLAVHGL